MPVENSRPPLIRTKLHHADWGYVEVLMFPVLRQFAERYRSPNVLLLPRAVASRASKEALARLRRPLRIRRSSA